MTTTLSTPPAVSTTIPVDDGGRPPTHHGRCDLRRWEILHNPQHLLLPLPDLNSGQSKVTPLCSFAASATSWTERSPLPVAPCQVGVAPTRFFPAFTWS